MSHTFLLIVKKMSLMFLLVIRKMLHQKRYLPNSQPIYKSSCRNRIWNFDYHHFSAIIGKTVSSLVSSIRENG